MDSKADLLLYGNAERALVALAHRLAAGEPIDGYATCAARPSCAPPGWLPGPGWAEMDSTQVDTPGPLIRACVDPYMRWTACETRSAPTRATSRLVDDSAREVRHPQGFRQQDWP
jgi:radical SAM superfamily enzyme YgiQ (UPF0313 family)